MASSLEKLLAEEGFRGRRSGMTSRASFRADAALKSLHPSQDKLKKDSPIGHRVKTERTRSDLSRYIVRGELPTSDSSSSRRPRDYLVSRQNGEDGRLKTESSERHHLSRLSNDFLNSKRNNDFAYSEEREITEIGVEEDTRVKDLSSDKVYNSERSRRSSHENREKHRYLERKGDSRKVSKTNSNNHDKNIINYTSSTDRKKKILGHPGPSYESSVRSSISLKNFEGDERQKFKNVSPELPKLALDEVAIKAMVSILNGYIKSFLKDDEFRIKLRQNCFSSLSQNEDGEAYISKSKVITNLEQAIETVEKAAEEVSSPKDLMTASMQLSMITSLNSNDLQEGSTAGILNSRLSACAHLYLSVAYKLQKKDKVSAKYLLQVFCDSPFLARVHLLRELFDYLFFPHLSHLEEWYNQEADSLKNAPNRIRKLKLLDKVYNEILDSGTYQIAVYYKDWLTEGIEASSPPSVHIPTMSFQEVQVANSQDYSSGLSIPSDSFSPRPMVNKKLYETVFGHSSSHETYQAEENIDNGGATCDGSAVEVNEQLTYSSEIVKYVDGDLEKTCRGDTQENAFLSDYESLSVSEEECKLIKMSSPPKMDINDVISNFKGHQEPAGNFHLLNAFSYTKSNELILMNLAESVFQLHQTEESGDLTIPVVSQTRKLQPIKVVDSYELELEGSYEYFDKGTFIASAPKDFICPLSGKLFEDPVTLETGNTFEREAIKDWFEQGNQACPVTGKKLKCQTVPFTNCILKRVIDNWKLEHCSHLMDLATKIVRNSGKIESRERDEAAIFIFELLLTTFSMEERLANAKYLVSLGGLEFLVRRFKLGNLEEKTRVAALLLCCIEGDASCRNQIAKTIERHRLFELLQSRQPKSRRNAVLLLIQLLCLCSRKDVKFFLSGLQDEEIMNAKHILLIYLQTSPPEQMPWVASLLLHLDLLVEPQKYSIYREEAVDAIAMALNVSLTDEKVQESSCRVLLALGGCFSAAGKSITESWILKEAGSRSQYEAKCQEDDSLLLEDEEETINEWLRNLSTSLINDGKRSFLDAISKCLASRNSDLVKASLITVTWLSCALSSLYDAEMHLSAFSALISGLKESLENSEQIEHKVLASISLLNFTKIPECRVLLMTIAEEIAVALQSLIEVTWIAKQLYHIISGEYC
ncbi:putative E3 ubiquitin-protein ligase LIN-1 isoform X2 [Euphorbia lathyris]|uniref:putative E3 ubiquitin-protein ligase LIN-1 isoform X2 n=1 Tax=Euphorbia lathyris TaxID=212925 RepID=UPI003313A6EF